ncbi:alpha-L-rhamnosidase C-terminal domain-containing protein [Nonomuraea sp. PA05]|uniref:alpha-L-rhamnosidase C-terminal domain-containing protein n=1 Tax=Nonomuraea sp. PA05 TaxID=2604466 RepID=UPI001CA347BE|nr:alpha-L-rhamnosidase C-terminal domain-containing protein [Nonomuraea sp. PA05]
MGPSASSSSANGPAAAWSSSSRPTATAPSPGSPRPPPAAPGHRRPLVRPRPGGGLTHARARHDTPYEPAAVSWSRDGETLTVTATVPLDTTALVALPNLAEREVAAGTHTFGAPL